MRILLTNDDGIHAPGLRAMYGELRRLGEVTVVAPTTEQSAVGHAITISDPLRVTSAEKNGFPRGYAVNGTPADCVKIAVSSIMKGRPNLVVSGVNAGRNTGTHIIYSGTVSAATEGTILRIPSMAVSLSLGKKNDFCAAARIGGKIARLIAKKGLPDGVLLNVNVPGGPLGKIKGIKVTQQGRSDYREFFEKRTDPSRRVYYWLSGDMTQEDPSPESDTWALRHNYVSVTPIQYDLTAYAALDELRQWIYQGWGRRSRGPHPEKAN